MLGLKKLAVTGGLSNGKSSVCRIFKELGAYVVSADKIVHQLLSSDETLIREVVLLLGADVCVNKKLEKQRIANSVFHNETLLFSYEKLIHPKVYKKIEEEYKDQCLLSSPPPLFVAEVPLLFETGGAVNFDFTLAVIANREISLKRFKDKGYDEKEFILRSNHQFSPHKKAELADYVIINDDSLSHLKSLTYALYEKLTGTNPKNLQNE